LQTVSIQNKRGKVYSKRSNVSAGDSEIPQEIICQHNSTMTKNWGMFISNAAMIAYIP
jgi:hypothetical protein